MEIWKDIIGYEGLYQVSSLGNVKSLDHFRKNGSGLYIQKGKVMKLQHSKDGYCKITMCLNGIKKDFRINRLVAQAFIPNTENKSEVNHINGIKTDNKVENLEWVNRAENERHKYKMGYKNRFQTNHPDLGKIGILNHNSKKVNQYTKAGEFIKTWDCIMDVKRDLKINNSNVSECCKGKKKTAGGFIWKYI